MFKLNNSRASCLTIKKKVVAQERSTLSLFI